MSPTAMAVWRQCAAVAIAVCASNATAWYPAAWEDYRAQDVDPATPEPRWEVGIGGFLTSFPNYRGSDQRSTFGLPGPYAAYRGERFNFSDGGLKADIFDAINAEFTVSIAASLPGDTDDDDARADMPELDPTFEIGPSLNLLYEPLGSRWKHALKMPVRGVVATDFRSGQAVGWLFHPHVTSTANFGLPRRELELGLSAGPLWASRKYHAYYYQVDPQFATVDRPAYTASSGYSGTRLTARLSTQAGRWRAAFYVLHDLLDNAAFEDSPLVRRDSATIVGLGFSYKLFESKRLTAEPEDFEPRQQRDSTNQ